MQIDLKDIIKPRFAIGQTVFVKQGDGSVKRSEIREWEMTIYSDGKPKFQYLMLHGNNWWPESSVFTTAEAAFDAKN